MLRTRLPLVVTLVVVLFALGVGVAVVWRTFNRPAAGVMQTAQAADVRVALQLDQPALGDRILDVTVHDARGRPVPLRRAQLRFTMTEMDMGESVVDAQPVGAGHYQARGPFFSMAGQWVVEVMLERDDGRMLKVPFAVAIAAPGESGGPLNPLAPDAAVVAAGRQVYRERCAVCHGMQGRGDGPAAPGLNPRPSDFTQHAMPGKHTDGQFFLWIKDGYPGTAMPAWGQQLTEQQIWQLVTYLRTFAATTAAASAPSATLQPSAPALPSQTTPVEALPPLVFVRQGALWRSDGSARPPQPLTQPDASAYPEFPVVAPDQRQIAFVTTSQAPMTGTVQLPLPSPKTTLEVMRADGSDRRIVWVPARGIVSVPAWTPDSRALYVSYAEVLSAPDAPVADRLFQIIRVDLATGERHVVLNDARDPGIARDGTRLVYLSFDKTYYNFTLHTANPDGSDDREVIGQRAFSDLAVPRFSPDARRIVFTAQGGPVTDPQGYPLQISGDSPVQRVLALFAPPTAEAHGSPWDVWMVNTDGTGLRRLPNVREDSPMAIFTPDGADIVMMGAGGIYRLRPDGSNLRKIDPSGDHGGLDWAAP